MCKFDIVVKIFYRCFALIIVLIYYPSFTYYFSFHMILLWKSFLYEVLSCFIDVVFTLSYHDNSPNPPLGPISCMKYGIARYKISWSRIAKLYTSPFCVPYGGHSVSGMRSSSGAVHKSFLKYWYSLSLPCFTPALKACSPNEVIFICQRLSTRQVLLRRLPWDTRGDWWMKWIP